MDKRGQQWREKREEDRTRDEVLEERTVMMNTRTQWRFQTMEMFHINNNICLSLTIIPLLRVKKIERFRMKRCIEEGAAVMAVITSLCELISCLFIDVVITCVDIRGTFCTFLRSLAVVDVVKVVVSQLVMI